MRKIEVGFRFSFKNRELVVKEIKGTDYYLGDNWTGQIQRVNEEVLNKILDLSMDLSYNIIKENK